MSPRFTFCIAACCYGLAGCGSRNDPPSPPTIKVQVDEEAFGGRKWAENFNARVLASLKEEESARARNREKAVASANVELAGLAEKKERSEKAAAELSKIKITEVKFIPKKTGAFGMAKINLTAENGTSVPISLIEFAGKLASPNRAVAWAEGDFHQYIPGGMEPGERQNLDIPVPYSPWEYRRAVADAVLEARAVRLCGPDKKVTLDSREFTERDADRVRQLKKIISE